MRRTLMAVHAHPDDECISTGGILARYAAEGERTILVSRGRNQRPYPGQPRQLGRGPLPRARRLRQNPERRPTGQARLSRLGMAGTPDNDNPACLQQADLEQAIEKVVKVVREERLDVIVTYDELGRYGHPDHIRAHRVAVAAFERAGDASRYLDTREQSQPLKLYYAVVPRSAMREFGERLRAAGIESPFRELDTTREDAPFGVDDERVTALVDVSAYVGPKRAALESHRSQMGPDQFFMKLPTELFVVAFGRETFQRVAGRGPTPESDLFDGLA